ncbi:MAG: hypothetical protein ACXVQJ_03605 [Actinomycetota bacterium]
MGGQGGPPVGGADLDWGPVAHPAHAWWGWFGVLLPTLLLLVLIGVVIWAVLRPSLRPAVAGGAPITPRPEGALEALRLRYARGEIDREAFLTASVDLGGQAPPPPAATTVTQTPSTATPSDET